jgi:hypothetical protein
VGLEEFRNALENTSEVELSVTGRKSGRESSRPVWFVEEGEKLFLLPVDGSDSNYQVTACYPKQDAAVEVPLT